MELSPVPTRPAPGFTLTDQDGRVLPLSAFRGKVVVPGVHGPSLHRHLPDRVRRVHRCLPRPRRAGRPGRLRRRQHQPVSPRCRRRSGVLSRPPADLHPRLAFLHRPGAAAAGNLECLHIAVQAPGPDADIVHSSVVSFIDPGGRERYLASPQADHTSSGASYLPADQIAAWGRGIAQVATLLAG
jgi:hypothetical protein